MMSRPAPFDHRPTHSATSPIAFLLVLFVVSFALGCSSGSGGGGGGGGSIDGTWVGKALSSYAISSSFTAKITEDNTKISGTITIAILSYTDEPITGTLNGTSITFGDISGKITFTGTINGNSASGTYSLPSYGDNGTWTAAKQ